MAAEDEMDYCNDFMDELSYDKLQQMMDEMLGDQSFSFGDVVNGIIQNGRADTAQSMLASLKKAVVSAFLQDQQFIVSLVVIALAGAVFSNFSKLLKGREVAETAFYIVYMLFFAMLASSFLHITQLAGQTMENLFTFMKAMVPSFMISLSFTQGGAAAGVYYEFTLIMLMAADWLLAGLALPAVHLYFFLQVVNQFSEDDMFSRMAELVRDAIRFGVKTVFGLMMGMNIIQGLVVPVSAEVKNLAVMRLGSAIPGVGNSVESVLQTVLCAGKLVKNAVGVAGVIAVFFLCAVPLIQMIVSRILLQAASAVLQPVSDKRLIRGLTGAVGAVDLYIYTVGAGAMLFISSIAIISAFTT